MKKFVISLCILLAAIKGFSQAGANKIWNNGSFDLQGKYSAGFHNASADSIFRILPGYTKLYKPEFLPRYTTATLPSASTFAGCVVFNTDSNKIYYSNGSAWTDPANSIAPGAVTSVSAGLGMSFTTITTAGPVKLDTSYAMTLNTTQASTGAKNFYGAVNFFGGGNAYINGGNSFGAAANIGTKDNNQINVIVNAANAISIFNGGSVRIGAGGVTGSQKLTVDGTIGIAGTLTVNANSGVSVLSGFNFSSFAANNSSNNIGFGWGMNNPYTTGVKVFTSITGDNSLASGTSSVKQIAITPTYNNSGAGTYTEWGVYYNPTLTSMTGTTHIAWENVSGDMKFNTTSGVSSFFGKANFAVPTTSIASINLAPSSAVDPSSPSVGDLWYNGTNLNFRKTGGTTVDLLAGGGGAQPFSTSTALFKDGTDPTKLLKFNISGFTTATTITWVFPNTSGTVARIDAGQTFVGTNTIPAPIITGLTTAPATKKVVMVDSTTGQTYWDAAVTPVGVGNIGSGEQLLRVRNDSLLGKSISCTGCTVSTQNDSTLKIDVTSYASSGVYKPTIANVLNTGTLLVDSFFYQQIGRVVHVSGFVTCIVASNNSGTEISFTLPVAATLGGNDLYGVANIQNPDGSYSAAMVYRNGTDHTKGSIAGKCGAGTTSTETTYLRFECTYKAY